MTVILLCFVRIGGTLNTTSKRRKLNSSLKDLINVRKAGELGLTSLSTVTWFYLKNV